MTTHLYFSCLIIVLFVIMPTVSALRPWSVRSSNYANEGVASNPPRYVSSFKPLFVEPYGNGEDQSDKNKKCEPAKPESSSPPSPMDPFKAVVIRPGPDPLAISSLVIAQSLLLALAVFLYRFLPALGSPGSFPFILFDQSSLWLAIKLSLPLIAAAAIFDRLPLSYPKQALRSTKIFVLLILGMSTPNLTAFITALALAIFAGNKRKSYHFSHF